MNKGISFAKALKLDLNFTEKFLELVHGESIRKQTEIMNAGKAEKGIAAETHTEVKS
ncbi:hypothetical protein D3C85_1758370 [compost metagenome]